MKNEASSFLKIVIKYNDIGTKALFAEATWNDDKKFVPKPIELKYYKFRNITILLKNTGSTFTWKIVAVNKVLWSAYNRKKLPTISAIDPACIYDNVQDTNLRLS